jgi:hypothetical protein
VPHSPLVYLRRTSGDTEEDGLFRYAANGLFEALQDQHHFEVEVSAYEIFKEGIYDLLSQTKKSIHLAYDHGSFGLSPSNLEHLGPVKSTAEASSYFKRAWTRRNGTSTDFGPAIDFSSFVFNIDLTITRRSNNRAMMPNSNAELIRSRFMIVELPCTDRLSTDPSTLRLKEGTTLNNSLVNFNIVSSSMSNASKATGNFAPYRSSLLTQVMHEAMGGNMFMRAIAVMSHGQYEESKQTLQLAHFLGNIQNFPISNGATVIGLLNRYRSEIQQLTSEGTNVSSSNGKRMEGTSHTDNSDEMQAKLHDLEGKVVRTNLDKVVHSSPHCVFFFFRQRVSLERFLTYLADPPHSHLMNISSKFRKTTIRCTKN